MAEIKDQMEQEDIKLCMALFTEKFLNQDEYKEYDDVRKLYAQRTGVKDSSPLALMFMTYCAGLDKGIELTSKVLENINEERQSK